MKRTLLAASAAITILGCAHDASARADSAAGAEHVTRMSDGAILGTLDVIDSVEIDAARLASTRASSPDVRAFATQLVRDHSAMRDATASAARAAGVTAAQTADGAAIRARGKSLLDTLATLTGKAFDLSYVDAQVSDHQMALQSIGAWQRYGADAHVLAVLRHARPAVQAHYDQALALLSPLSSAGEPSVWKKHLGQPAEASGTPPSR